MSELMQLPLDVALRDDDRFENFYIEPHQQAFQAVKQFVTQQIETVLYLWGQQGVGKSHLVHAAMEAARDNHRTVLLINQTEDIIALSKTLERYNQELLLCLDNFDQLIVQAAWQEVFFHAFNAVKEQGGQLLVASRFSPRQLDLQLEDLRSRMSWGQVYHMSVLSDLDKMRILQFRAKQRGLKIADEVAIYLLNRMPRNMDDLFQVLVTLDQASIAAQRSITIPFVKQVFSILASPVRN